MSGKTRLDRRNTRVFLAQMSHTLRLIRYLTNFSYFTGLHQPADVHRLMSRARSAEHDILSSAHAQNHGFPPFPSSCFVPGSVRVRSARTCYRVRKTASAIPRLCMGRFYTPQDLFARCNIGAQCATSNSHLKRPSLTTPCSMRERQSVLLVVSENALLHFRPSRMRSVWLQCAPVC